MFSMKKIVLILLVMVLALMFSGCGGSVEEAASVDDVVATVAPDSSTEDSADPQEESETDDEISEPDEAPALTTIVFHSVAFDLFDGWVWRESDEASGVINIDNGEGAILVIAPRDHISSNLDLSDMNLTFEGMLLSMLLDSTFDAQDVEYFPMPNNENLRYPTLGATFITQRFGDVMWGASFLIFGETQYIIVHATSRHDSSIEVEDIINFAASIEFVS